MPLKWYNIILIDLNPEKFIYFLGKKFFHKFQKFDTKKCNFSLTLRDPNIRSIEVDPVLGILLYTITSWSCNSRKSSWLNFTETSNIYIRWLCERIVWYHVNYTLLSDLDVLEIWPAVCLQDTPKHYCDYSCHQYQVPFTSFAPCTLHFAPPSHFWLWHLWKEFFET